ncbi:hypothetical protein AVEN_261927-1 [Araneus ventricosus]|uniref:Uncharacterized protein n=1 Tax=Araneus ventricosus TaxID=182803 RepID=A0A4Y2MWH4_ARAVE|nr:hypothetical protein AVEN_261927-1 [Araneus ventricosus]
MPKQQSGNTNDGNTALKFFRHPVKTAEITGVELNLIKRLGIILECINCKMKINSDKFAEFTRVTQDIYLRNYSWHPMPVSVHKILFHGRDIIAACILHIGSYAEEAQEARNKHNRQCRELFTRKTSRINTNTDLLHRLLIASDPYIASLRAAPKSEKRKMDREMKKLLELSLSDEEDFVIVSEDSSEESNSSELNITYLIC